MYTELRIMALLALRETFTQNITNLNNICIQNQIDFTNEYLLYVSAVHVNAVAIYKIILDYYSIHILLPILFEIMFKNGIDMFGKSKESNANKK